MNLWRDVLPIGHSPIYECYAPDKGGQPFIEIVFRDPDGDELGAARVSSVERKNALQTARRISKKWQEIVALASNTSKRYELCAEWQEIHRDNFSVVQECLHPPRDEKAFFEIAFRDSSGEEIGRSTVEFGAFDRSGALKSAKTISRRWREIGQLSQDVDQIPLILVDREAL
jgi:hypothetical protein